MKENINFVARHYRRGRFDAKSAWRKLGIRNSSLRRWRIAVMIAVALGVSATAMVLYRAYNPVHTPQSAVENVSVSPMSKVMVIDFESAPLTEVVAEIESVYGVKVGNLPDDPAKYSLSLKYEGNPQQLVDAINDILGLQLTVAER